MTDLAPPGLREPPDPVGAYERRARGRNYLQLTIDGGEVDVASVRRRPWGPNQKEALRQLAFGSLTSTQAGVIVHSRRGSCVQGQKDVNKGDYRGAGCCRYAASNGSALMKSLERAGVVSKVGGLWFPVHS